MVDGVTVSFVRNPEGKDAAAAGGHRGLRHGHDGDRDGEGVTVILSTQVKTFGHGMEVAVAKPKRTLGYTEDPAYAACDITVAILPPSLPHLCPAGRQAEHG